MYLNGKKTIILTLIFGNQSEWLEPNYKYILTELSILIITVLRFRCVRPSTVFPSSSTLHSSFFIQYEVQIYFNATKEANTIFFAFKANTNSMFYDCKHIT